MTARLRDEQEMRNGVEVMAWIEHLTAHPDVPLDLNLICFFNRLVLQTTDRDYWAGRPRSTVAWQAREEWSRRRASVSPEDSGLAVADIETGELITHFPPDEQVGVLLDDLLQLTRLDSSGSSK